MRFIKKEHQFWFVGIANFGKVFEQLRQQPQKERRIKPGGRHQTVCRKNVNAPRTMFIANHQISQIKRRFAKKLHATFVFQNQQPPLDGTN